MGYPAWYGYGWGPSHSSVATSTRLDRNLSPSQLGRLRLRRRCGGRNILSTPRRSGSGWLPLWALRPRHQNLPSTSTGRAGDEWLSLFALRPQQVHHRVETRALLPIPGIARWGHRSPGIIRERGIIRMENRVLPGFIFSIAEGTM